MTNEELQKIKERSKAGVWNADAFLQCESDRAALLAHCKELEAEVERLKGDGDMIQALMELGKPYMELTTKLKEHPEKYDRPCLCELCRSYGD